MITQGKNVDQGMKGRLLLLTFPIKTEKKSFTIKKINLKKDKQGKHVTDK